MKKNQIKMGLEGYFTFRLYRADGTLKRELKFKNLILDGGLNRMGGLNIVINYCRIGSGSSTPLVGQSALDAQLAYSGTLQAQESGHDAAAFSYIYRRVTYRFDQGVGTGNISEVGMGWDMTGTTLFSRALVVDVDENPTTITKLADEVLDVTYELRAYTPGDSSFTFDLSGTEITALCRPQGVGTSTYWSLQQLFSGGTNIGQVNPVVYTGAIGANKGALPAGSGATLSSAFNGAYSSGSFERNFRMTAALNAGNQLHRTYFLTANWCSFGFEITPTFTKLNTQILTLDWKISWDRRP